MTYRVNMERLRWQEPRLPSSGRWVLLNVGAAELMAMEGEAPVFGVNVVVGRPSRRTPLTNDKITGLKFSPDWTAPYSIVEKDLVPLALEKGPDFLNKMGLSIFDDGRRVSPFDLDFNTINVRDYVWKQESGPQNVLGVCASTLPIHRRSTCTTAPMIHVRIARARASVWLYPGRRVGALCPLAAQRRQAR